MNCVGCTKNVYIKEANYVQLDQKRLLISTLIILLGSEIKSTNDEIVMNLVPNETSMLMMITPSLVEM